MREPSPPQPCLGTRRGTPARRTETRRSSGQFGAFRAPAVHVLGTRAESGVPREPSRAGKGAAPETQLNFLHPTRASAHRPVPQRLQDHLFGRISNPKWTPFLCRVFHPNDCRSRSTCVSTGRFASALVEVLELFRRGDFGTGRCAVTKRVAWSRRVIWQASADQTFRRRHRCLFEGKRRSKEKALLHKHRAKSFQFDD